MRIITGNEEIWIKDYGLRDLRHVIPSPSFSHSSEKMDGADGEIPVESNYVSRDIKVFMRLLAKKTNELPQLKRKFNQLFARREEFFVVFDKEPWRRWKVKLNSAVEWENVNAYRSNAELDLICYSGFAESIGTTLSMPDGASLYTIGEGKIYEGDPDIKYQFSDSSFSVFNDSDIDNDPAEHREQNITLKGILNNPVIRNLTTGDVWSWTGTATTDDVIELKGIRSLKNDVSIFGQTNNQVITFAPGWNEFQIEGAVDFIISFDLRFYYF